VSFALIWNRKYIWCIIWLLASIGLSNSNIFLFGTCLILAAFDFRSLTRKQGIVLFLISCTYAAVYYYYLTVMYFNSPVRSYMTEFWQYAFVPSNILYSEFYIWFIQRGLSINYEVFFYNIFHTESIKYLLIFLPVLISFFQVFGVWKLIVRKKYRFLL